MAERHGYAYEIIGRELAEPYVSHATKWWLLLQHLSALPRDQLVFYLDANDGFVCDGPDVVLDRYLEYEAPVVFSAERHSTRRFPFDVPDPEWVHSNAGAFVGQAGVVGDALREGLALEPSWRSRGHVSDQLAMRLWFHQPGREQLATLDHRRVIVQSLPAVREYVELPEHRAALEDGRPAPTAAVHFYGDNGRGYNEFAPLYGLEPATVQKSGRFAHPIWKANTPVPRAASGEPMPRLAHFVFGERGHTRDFHLVHALAIRSCIDTLRPDEVLLHCHDAPAGEWWDAIASEVSVHAVAPRADGDPSLDALAKHGGLYLGLDTLMVARFSERLWRAPFVIGRAIRLDATTGEPRPTLSAAAMLSQPGSAFVEALRTERAARPSIDLERFVTAHNDAVHIEPQRTFHAFEPTRAGLALLLDERAPHLDDDIATIQLGADLWWSGDRPDLTGWTFERLDQTWVRDSGSTYARAARPFLEALVRDR